MALTKVVTISTGQSLFDISLQYYGTIERVYELVDLLGLDSINSDPTGKQFTVTETNNIVYQRTVAKGITIGTKDSPELIQSTVPITYYRITEAGDQRITEASEDRILE